MQTSTVDSKKKKKKKKNFKLGKSSLRNGVIIQHDVRPKLSLNHLLRERKRPSITAGKKFQVIELSIYPHFTMYAWQRNNNCQNYRACDNILPMSYRRSDRKLPSGKTRGGKKQKTKNESERERAGWVSAGKRRVESPGSL